ncbi:MAG: LCP family protein [Ruminococcus sp.]|nr:LCP family protein [Ruminococcus sp.]
MPYRYNGRESDNIKNTDDEDTMLIPGGFPDEPPRSELPQLKRINRRAGSAKQKPKTDYTADPPQFPQSGKPPAIPQPAQQHSPEEPGYYDYNNKPPQWYVDNSSTGNEAPPPAVPPPMAQPSRPPRPKRDTDSETEKPVRKKKKHRHKSLTGRIIRRILRIIIILFLLLFGIYSCTSVALINKMEHKPSGSRTHYADSVGRGYVRSFLIIGTDGRSADEQGRSDSMILVSLNSKTNEIIMTSFMRDCYVEIPNNGWNKLNAAYAFGGPELLMDTLEYNFDVRIDDYVTVDFASFVSLVDSVGGVDIEVSDAEAEEINVILISEVNELMGDDRMSDLLDGGGKLHLNGKQALSYSRIRKVGNSDFERTERQRRVLSLIIAKLRTFRPSMFKNLASDVIPDISTNMSTLKAYLLSLRAPLAARYATKQVRIPAEGTYYDEDVDVGSVLQIDRDENIRIIEEEVFAKK